MTTALLIVDVQQGLCEGEGRAFESDAPRLVIEHHNATLTNISSFGPRVLAVASADLQIGA